ncbi:MAG: PilN domain-containing protein [Candidatus Marithrix sp.]|nr:PilN domain-containing protein [Candidatus Marithrix sp.]
MKKSRNLIVSCDICLIVYNSVLLHIESQDIVAQPDESLLKLTPNELADAARRLLPVTNKRPRIALALPSDEFVATSLQLPAVASQNLKSVVNLQLPTLLPGITEPLLLAVQAPISGEQTIALWMSVKRANELFQAFDEVGLFLNCILPRSVISLPSTSNSYRLLDEDEGTTTCLEWSDGVIQHWLHTTKLDCDNTEFQAQFEENTSFSNDIELTKRVHIDDWQKQAMPSKNAYDYAFIPPGAAANMAQATKKKKQRYLIGAILLLIVGIMGGIYFALDYEKGLKQHLAKLENRTNTVSHLRAEVGEIENLIGPVKKFPRQEIVKMLEILNALIPKDSWITNFSIESGVVRLDGLSPDPTQIIEVLTKENNFIEVEQSKDIVKNRGRSELQFGIEFKLKGVDLEGYLLEYFPDR